MHKCQGMAQLLSLPGPSFSSFQLVESTIPGQREREERSLFDGIDTTVAGLAQYAGPRPPRELTNGLAAIATAALEAQRAFDAIGDHATLAPLLSGLRAVRNVRGVLRTLSLDDNARFEIDFRLRQKEREFQQAVVLANGIRIDALANDGVVVAGQPVTVAVTVANRGLADVTVQRVHVAGFTGDRACALTTVSASGGFGGPGGGGRGGGAPAAPSAPVSILKRDQAARCEVMLTVPANAVPTEPYWRREGDRDRYTFAADAPFGVPYRPTPFYVQVTLAFAGASGEEVIEGLPVQYRYEGNIFSGEKRSELLVVPAQSVRVSPDIAIVPTIVGGTQVPALAGRQREVRVTVVNDSNGAAESVVTLDVPDGWALTPADHVVRFTREGEAQTVRFQVRPNLTAAPGQHLVAARVTSGAGAEYRRGYQVIEYPHITRQHIYRDAVARVNIVDVKTRPKLIVGYVMGVGDEVPAAIAQLGAEVVQLGPDDLAWGDLSRFPTIVTGVRAYERRADLRANNGRLLDYVASGGTLIVQYNKFEFNEAQYGPFPAEVSNDRVTDEFAPMRVLEPSDPVFTAPNRISDEAWSGWVQERGLYFLGAKDSRYRDLVELEDPFANNPGVKRGALVVAAHGKGKWVYVGLGLWRELPAGVAGAYQLLANLISLD